MSYYELLETVVDASNGATKYWIGEFKSQGDFLAATPPVRRFLLDVPGARPDSFNRAWLLGWDTRAPTEKDGLGYTVSGSAITEAAPPAPSLQEAQQKKCAALDVAFDTAASADVAYMGTVFQADMASRDMLNQVLTALLPSSETPPGFYWVDANNAQVPMTFIQLQGLAAEMLSQGWAAFQRLQTRKAAVRAASAVDQVQAIAW